MYNTRLESLTLAVGFEVYYNGFHCPFSVFAEAFSSTPTHLFHQKLSHTSRDWGSTQELVLDEKHTDMGRRWREGVERQREKKREKTGKERSTKEIVRGHRSKMDLSCTETKDYSTY